MAAYIQQIYLAFHNAPESHVLIIKGSERHGYTFSASAIYDESVAIRTQKLFKHIFAEFSVQEILDHLSNPKLTKAALRRIFVKMAVFCDQGPSFDFSNLQELEHIFLDKTPKETQFLEDKAATSGKEFEGLCEKVYLQWHHYFAVQTENDPEKRMIREAEFLTSRMADREFQEGEYIYLAKDAIFQVDATFIHEGAYVSILKSLSDSKSVKLICRGTAMRRSATDGLKSGMNDLQYEIGNGGVQGVWPHVADYLKQQSIHEVELYGKSLGGAHAQRLAVLVMKHSQCLLKSLTTVCSVGVGSEAEGLFKGLVEQDERFRKLNLTIIRNGGEEIDKGADYIPCVGGDHLGATVDAEYLNLKVYYIHPISEQIYPPQQDLNFFQKGVRFASSFSAPHVRQSTLLDFSYNHLDRPKAQTALQLGRTLEGPRRCFAYKNTRSFSEIVNPPTNELETQPIEKIVLIASTVFFILFYIGFVTCLELHPGTIIYQGNGLILTIPTIVMAAGTGLSLVTITITLCSLCASARNRDVVLLT
jgi:hypothetical protein